MRYTTTIKVVLEDAPTVFLPNVKVSLFDRDRLSKDDPLGTAVTDANGEAQLQYDTDSFADADERLGTEFPDLYAVVYDAEGQVVTNTRTDTIPNTPRKRLTVPIPRDLATRHRLLNDS